VADDVADNSAASVDERLQLLDQMRRTLLGETDASPEAAALRSILATRALTPQHGLDLLEAFRRDVTKLRYTDWNDLMDYCRVSAMPVGRFVLDVHGEERSLWPASDALCAALQIINHLQDCAADYRLLDRVYIPLDAFAAASTGPESLGEPRASAALRAVIIGLTRKTSDLLMQSKPFAGGVRDARLALEISVIQVFAEDLCRRLTERDPLSERVHHRRTDMMKLLMPAAIRFAALRLRRNRGVVLANERQ
jgi:squalene synthase HpnC